MRDRLIELLHNAEIEYLSHGIQMIENAMNEDLICPIENKQNFIADYILANGVIVPPCKVGDKIYVLLNGKVIQTEVLKVKYEEEAENHSKFIRERVYAVVGNVLQMFDFSDFGKTVFTSREDAEKALKGGAE